LLHSSRYLLFGGLGCRPILTFLSSLNTLVSAGSLLRLLALLLCFLSGRLLGLLLLGFACFLATKLLAPLLLLLGLDLSKEIAGCADLVADR